MLFANLDRYHFLGVHLDGREAIVAVVNLANEVVWSDQRPTAVLRPELVEPLVREWTAQVQERGYRIAGIGICPARPREGVEQAVKVDSLPGTF